MERKNRWEGYSEVQLGELEEICERYKTSLNVAKTERESVKLAVKLAKDAGYQNIRQCIEEGKQLEAGDKVFAECMGKTLVLFEIGQEPLEKGMNILGAHVDSPRIDVKQNRMYEDSNMAYLDTHYYGGIKKYQWVALPMALHGVVVKKDGTVLEVVIGEEENEPVLVITDLLVHLSQEQIEKKASIVIEGENLDVLIGTRPAVEKELTDEEKKEKVKTQILRLLKSRYNIEEEDFLSAELEIVPAGKARDCGLDGSMIIGYGQDDRVCAFPSLFALLETKHPKRTACCILVDKEEIGSVGATGMQSRFFENTVAELAALTGGESELKTKRALANSYMLSSDVSAGYDPLYASAFEKKNSAYLGRGLVLNKFTGSRGKAGSNDANPEYIAKLRSIFDREDIGFQTAEMGRVDLGGGGTIAFIMANYGMQVIDSGVAVLCMHAPYEVTSKADVYEAYRGYKAFLKDMA